MSGIVQSGLSLCVFSPILSLLYFCVWVLSFAGFPDGHNLAAGSNQSNMLLIHNSWERERKRIASHKHVKRLNLLPQHPPETISRPKRRLCTAWLVPGFLPISKLITLTKGRSLMNVGTKVWIGGRMHPQRKVWKILEGRKIGSEC